MTRARFHWLRRRWPLLLCLGLPVLPAPVPGHAQTRPQPPSLIKKVQVTPFFGAFILEDLSYDNTSFFGARIGTDITARYSLEAGLAYASTGFRFDFNNQSERESVDMLLFFADFFYNYPLSADFIAYGTFGVGGLASYPESRGSTFDTFFNFGGGLKVFLRPDLLLRLEVRQYSPDFDIAFFNPRSGTVLVRPSGSPKSDIQKILTITGGVRFVL